MRAKANLQILEADIQVAVTAGIEQLKARGDYVEYARGEHYQAVPGVLSAGEETENGGVQLFYLYPEEFGDIYAKRKRREKIAETAVRKVVSLLQPKKNE